MLYKNKEDWTYKLQTGSARSIQTDKMLWTFSADCGKFGTDEVLAAYELSVKDLLQIIQKHFEGVENEAEKTTNRIA